jgi:hypothetical protein
MLWSECGTCVRPVLSSQGCQSFRCYPVPRGPIFYTNCRGEAHESAGLASNFHISEAPAVTAGFIGFSFDIREEQK